MGLEKTAYSKARKNASDLASLQKDVLDGAAGTVVQKKVGSSFRNSRATMISASTEWTLPDSMTYKVGSNTLEVYCNNLSYNLGQQYTEVGINGSISNKISFSDDISADADIKVVVTNITQGDIESTSVTMGGLVVEPYGHHLATRLDNRSFQTVYAGTPVTEQGSNGTVYYPRISPPETRIVTHGNVGDLSGPLKDGAEPEFASDFSHDWITKKVEYNIVPQQAYFLKDIYWKVGSVAPIAGVGDSVRMHAYRGTDELGIKIFDKSTVMTQEFIDALVPGAEIRAGILEKVPNGIDYQQGEEVHWVVEMVSIDPTHNLSFLANEGLTSPWRAVDRQQEVHVALVPVSSVFATPIITSPTDGQTAVSLTPTITTMKGVSKYGTHQSSTAVTAPANTTANILVSIPLPPNFLGTKGSMIGSVMLGYSGAGTKNLVLSLNGTTLYSTPTFAASTSVLEFSLYRSATGQITVGSISQDDGEINNTTIDLSGGNTLTLTGTKSVASDVLTMTYYNIFCTNSDSDLVGEYEHGGTVVQVKRNSDQVIIHDNNKVLTLSDTLTAPLSGSTAYSARAVHYNKNDVPIGRGVWVNFRTVMDLLINVNTGMTAEDLVEFDIGESVNASGFDFHLGGDSAKFPPASADSGDFRFKDSTGVDLLFKVQSVIGITPNRTAKCYVSTNAQVISDKKVKLGSAGAAASNVSQVLAWPDNTLLPVMSTTVGATGENYAGFTLRQVIKAGTINGSGLNRFKLNLRRGTTGTAVIQEMYLGVAAASGDAYDFASTPVKVTAGGASSFTMTDDAVYTTDPIGLDLPDGSNLVLSAYITAGTLGYEVATSDLRGYYKNVSDATTVDATGYSDSARKYLVESIVAGNFGNIASGGDITYSGTDAIHTFKASGSFIPTVDMSVKALVVGGGAGGDGGVGGGVYGHGGGGGFVNYLDTLAVTAGPIAVVIGAGGASGLINTQASNGVASSIGALTAAGGLKANNIGTNGDGGDSGKTVNGVVTNYTGGADGVWSAGAGAGAGASVTATGASIDASNGTTALGGDGYSSDITGTTVAYGPGGNGSGTGTGVPVVSPANIGKGGNGHGSTPRAGGSGVVIVRYPIPHKTIHTDKYSSIS